MRLPKLKHENQQIGWLIIAYAMVMLFIAFFAKGTGDEGDSIMHYLFAQTAWRYPQHFFDHWAKPIYVLFAFPFSQLGFVGVKLMNIGFNCGSIWFTYQIAKELEFKWAWAPAVLLVSTPMFNHLSLSGLTEPMSACFLSLGLLLLIREKWMAAVLLFSFFPFVRSEGLLMMAVVFVYLLIHSKYQYLPLLITGHLFYGLAGYPIYKDVFWVFNKMTYATWASAYGKGTWMHFVNNLPEILGTVMAIIFFASLLYGFVLLVKYVKKQLNAKEHPELFLIYGSLVIYFLAHTSFWALGIFNSGGILRVMITIMPLMALVNYRGIEYLFAFIEKEAIQKKLQLGLIILVFLFPFSGHVYAYRWNRDFVPKADQYAQMEMADWIKQTYPDYQQHVFYYEAVYISELLKQDWFNPAEHQRWLGSFERGQFKSGDFLIWDDWFAQVEGRIKQEPLEKDQRVQKIKTFQRVNYWGETRTTIVYRWK